MFKLDQAPLVPQRLPALSDLCLRPKAEKKYRHRPSYVNTASHEDTQCGPLSSQHKNWGAAVAQHLIVLLIQSFDSLLELAAAQASLVVVACFQVVDPTYDLQWPVVVQRPHSSRTCGHLCKFGGFVYSNSLCPSLMQSLKAPRRQASTYESLKLIHMRCDRSLCFQTHRAWCNEYGKHSVQAMALGVKPSCSWQRKPCQSPSPGFTDASSAHAAESEVIPKRTEQIPLPLPSSLFRSACTGLPAALAVWI